eukprot:151151-Amphidinium_carterae.1
MLHEGTSPLMEFCHRMRKKYSLHKEILETCKRTSFFKKVFELSLHLETQAAESNNAASLIHDAQRPAHTWTMALHYMLAECDWHPSLAESGLGLRPW